MKNQGNISGSVTAAKSSSVVNVKNKSSDKTCIYSVVQGECINIQIIIYSV